VGIDDFGARLAESLTARPPKRGQWLRQGQKFATLIRDGQRTDLVSPIEGEVTNVNEALTANTSLANTDPYGEVGSFSVISPICRSVSATSSTVAWHASGWPMRQPPAGSHADPRRCCCQDGARLYMI